MTIYFQILWKRIFYVIITFVVTVGLVAFLTSRMEPIYKASTTLLVVPFGLGAPDYATYLYSAQLSTTFSAILESDLVTKEAEAQLGIDKLPDFDVVTIPRSELLEVIVTERDPVMAQRVSQLLAEILVERAQSQYGASLANIEASLGARLNELEAEIDGLITERANLLEEIPRNNLRLAEVDRLISSREGTYNQVLADYNQTQRAQAEQANLVSILQPAFLPTEPAGPRMALNVAAAGVVGLIGGVAIAFLLELLQPKLYSDRQIEAVLHAPIVGRISKIKKQYRGNVFEGDSTAIERFRRLRTNIQVQSNVLMKKTFMVASAKPENGKSTISVNIAISLAYNANKVIVVDTDIYHPTVHSLLHVENGQGLSDVLTEQAILSEVIQLTSIPNLAVLTTGAMVIGFSELLDSEKMRNLITQLEVNYDYIIFDASPVLAMSDASVLAAHVGGVLFVTQPDAPKQMIVQAHQELERVGAHMAGVILNGVRYDPTSPWASHYLQQVQQPTQ